MLCKCFGFGWLSQEIPCLQSAAQSEINTCFSSGRGLYSIEHKSKVKFLKKWWSAKTYWLPLLLKSKNKARKWMTPLTEGFSIYLQCLQWIGESTFELVSRHKSIDLLKGSAINTESPGCLAHQAPPGSVLMKSRKTTFIFIIDLHLLIRDYTK